MHSATARPRWGLPCTLLHSVCHGSSPARVLGWWIRCLPSMITVLQLVVATAVLASPAGSAANDGTAASAAAGAASNETAAAAATNAPPKKKRNVLLIIVDDLRPEVAYYNESFMITPNIDRLGRSGLVLNRAFCQQAVCGATRNSFLSGRRPQRTKSWNFQNDFRQVDGGQDWISFPQYFKENGYTTLGSGKTFHPGIPPNWDLPKSWSNYGVGCDKFTPPHTWNVSKHCQSAEPNPPTESNRSYVFATNGYPQCTQPEAQRLGWNNKSMVCPDRAPIETFGDTIDTQATLNDMEYASKLGKPFFLATGIHRPHLPWHMPREFWDMYPPTEEIDLPKHQRSPTGKETAVLSAFCIKILILPRQAWRKRSRETSENNTVYAGMPPVAFTYECDGRTELCAFDETVPIPFPSGIINGSSGQPAGAGRGCADGAACVPPPNITRSFRKGYYASVSYADYLVGLLLDKLQALQHEEDTVVGLIGDHGWQLGEHNIWGKHSNFELGTRVPMIIRAPHLPTAVVSDILVESVDLYPTMAALAGLAPPPDLDGVDLSPLFTDPSSEIKPSVAFSEYPRCAPPETPWDDRGSCGSTPREDFDVMGLSVRKTFPFVARFQTGKPSICQDRLGADTKLKS